MERLFDIGFAPIQRRLGMGFQYTGSKEMIAPQIIQRISRYLPNATCAYDLFGGGGAMALGFVASGLTTIYNELKTDMTVMWEYVTQVANSTPRHTTHIFPHSMYQFCSRDEFMQIYNGYKAKVNLTPEQLIKRYIYSFNCYGDTYFKSEFKTQLATAGHTLIAAPVLNGDIAPAIATFAEYLGTTLGNDPTPITRMLQEYINNPVYAKYDIYRRRRILSTFLTRIEAICLAQILVHYASISFNRLLTLNGAGIRATIAREAPNLAKKQYTTSVDGTDSMLCGYEGFNHIGQFQHIQQLERLESVKELDTSKLTIENKSYADFDFPTIAKEQGLHPDDVVIFCDPPYAASQDTNAKAYHHSKFDTQAFVEWTKHQIAHGFKVFLTEYDNPNPHVFQEIGAWQKISASTANESTRTERLFMAM